MTESVQEVPRSVDVVEDGPLYCTVHPDVETSLRCNKCGRPMCTKCAVRTPVGYRCKECVRGQQDVFYSATQRDYVIAGAVSFGLGLVAAYLLSGLGLLFTIFLAPMAGSVIAQAVRWFTGRRRGRYTGQIVAGGIVVGALPALWPVVQLLALGVPLGGLTFLLLNPVLFVALSAGVAYSWFRYR